MFNIQDSEEVFHTKLQNISYTKAKGKYLCLTDNKFKGKLK